MSYCRFSCDNFRSDVYVYESCMGGFVTHVAGNKKLFPPIPDIPLHWLPNFGATWSQAERRMSYPSRWREFSATIVFGLWTMWHRISMWSLHVIPSRPIGLPHDGEQFTDDTSTWATTYRSMHVTGFWLTGRIRDERHDPILRELRRT